MKYKQILIIITIIVIGIQSKVYSQNFTTIEPMNVQKYTLYDIEKKYTSPKNNINLDSLELFLDNLEFTERKIPKIRRIFKAGKTYHYKATYLASNNDTLSNSIVTMKTTGKRWEYQPEKQDLVYYELPDYKADSIKLCNHNINTEFQHWKDKTGEGVIENIEQVWMHPIRINQYKFTEIAPFPEVQYPLRKGKKWGNTTMIGEGWGEWNGQTIEDEYKITGQTNFLLKDFKINCWIIKSAAKCPLGKSKLTTFFNEEYGFVKMVYKNYENETLVFELVNVEKKQ